MVNSPVLTKVELSEPSVLTIHNVDLSDQMNIQCNATNKHGYVFADVAINVSRTWKLKHIMCV